MLKEYNAIIHSEILFRFFSIYTYVLISCFRNPNFGFVVQIPQLISLKNEKSFTASVTWSILLSLL